jgi:hypothetical protein
MDNFITIDEDQFEKKTTYQNSKELDLIITSGPLCSCNISYRRVVVMPDEDRLVIDLKLDYDGSNWLNLNSGKIIILVDGEAITLNQPVENYHDCKVYDKGETHYEESCYFEIDKDLLKRICDSKSFGMQIYTNGGRMGVDNVNAIVVYSKLFYNAVYDSTAYTDVVANALEVFKSNSTIWEIELDGSGAKKGCMGMLILLVTFAAGAIGGICALV